MKMSVDKIRELYTEDLSAMIEVTEGRDVLAGLFSLEYKELLTELLVEDANEAFEHGFKVSLDRLGTSLSVDIANTQSVPAVYDTVFLLCGSGRRGTLNNTLSCELGIGNVKAVPLLGKVRERVLRSGYEIGHASCEELVADCLG